MPKAQKQALSPEECLSQALVPKDKQPYVVPENWIWVRFGYVILSSDEKADSFSADTKYIGLEHIEKDNGIVGYGESTELKSLKNVFVAGDILYGKLRPYLNKHDIAKFDGVCSTDILVFKPVQHYDIRLANYFLDLSHFIEFAVANSKGINLPRVSKEVVFAVPVPLPPLAEQYRIVTRIESLFEKLDRAKELVQSALDSFENRKAAILHKAFTGELTAKWRERNGISFDGWEAKTLDNMCQSIYDGDHMPPPKSETGLPFLVISNINTGYISLNATRFVPETYYDSLSTTRKPESGDVLYSVTGSFGIPALVENSERFCFQRHIALLRPDKSKLDSRCLWYILQTFEVYAQVNSIATGTAQRTVPIKGLRQITFTFPTLQEQQAIVQILDSLLENEKVAQGFANTLGKIDHMKKAILARAFRGELGTNDPSEESPLESLC